MSQENTEASLDPVNPARGTLNEAVRASILAVQASHRAARRRQLRDRLVALAAAGLTFTAIWGLTQRFGGEEVASVTTTTSAAEVILEPPVSEPVAAEAVEAETVFAIDTETSEQAVAAPVQEELVPVVVPAPSGTLDPALASVCDKAVKRKHWVKVASVCSKAFDNEPTAKRALSVAQAHHRRGRIAEAGTWAERVLALEPANPEAFILVAHAAKQTEHKARAKAAYRQYLALAPRGWHANEARQALDAAD